MNEDYADHGKQPASTALELRDYFAARVMQTFMTGAVLPEGFDASEVLLFSAKRAYETADAMLKARLA